MFNFSHITLLQPQNTMKKNIIFATIPASYRFLQTQEMLNQWEQYVQIANIGTFPVARIVFFVNPSSVKYIPLFFQFLKGKIGDTRIRFVKVITNLDFNVENFNQFYSIYAEWFSKYQFDTEQYDYYMYFARGNHFAHAFLITTLINVRHLPCRIAHLRRNRHAVSPAWLIEIYEAHFGKWIAEIGAYERQYYNTQSLLKSSIPTNNGKFNALIADIEHIAMHSTAPILLLGPTGSGKSQLARRVYELRKKVGTVRGNFVSVNCATLHGDTAYSTLFGHVKGAFTGAAANRNGLLKTADGGILFLDEIGELSLELQAQLLKAIEEKSYLPMGSDTEIQSDFQLICATNKVPSENIAKGLFRQDLYARINLWEFSMPGLAERPEDIEPNIEYELRRLREEKGLLADFTPEARKAYLDFATSTDALWPDNFRSLISSMERMVTFSLYGSITLDIVLREIELLKANWNSRNAAACEKIGDIMQGQTKNDRFPLQNKLADLGLLSHSSQRDLFDAVQLEEVLTVCKNAKNRSEAGRKLFAFSRQKKKSSDDTARLNKYLKTYSLSFEDTQKL